jgi:hypothetical protein
MWNEGFTACGDLCSKTYVDQFLAICDPAVIGIKNEDACNTCIANLESTVGGMSTMGNCEKWPRLYAECSGVCEKTHEKFAACPDPVPAEKKDQVAVPKKVIKTADTCRRCVLARSSEVTKCMPNADGSFPDNFLGEEKCVAHWKDWLSGCSKECPADDTTSNDLLEIFEKNFITLATKDERVDEHCEICIFSQPDGSDCLWHGGEECCEKWNTQWLETCRYECGATARELTSRRVCAAEDKSHLGDKVDNGASVLAISAALVLSVLRM